MFYRVCIPTAGIGSRLNNLTKNINKSLLEVDGKPIISHIVEKFPKQIEFVIPIGFKGNLVKQYLRLAHPERKFYFVNIKKFKGKDSGLGLSLWKAKNFLQNPFIFISCDSFIKKKKLLEPNINYIGYSNYYKKNLYRGITYNKSNTVIRFLNKNFKKKQRTKTYIGIAGIKDFKSFWSNLEVSNKDFIREGEFFGLKKMKNKFYAKNISWHDTGTKDQYLKLKIKFTRKRNILDKEKEKIWFVNKKVIKYFDNSKIIKKKIKRSVILKKYVPNIENFTKNMYSYNEVSGAVLSHVCNVDIFNKLLVRIKDFHKIKSNNKKKSFIYFYKHKTFDRVKQFYKRFNISDNSLSINGVKTIKLSKVLDSLDWNNISNGIPSNFHGDLHFDNILYNKNKKKFTFLDWREDFQGNVKFGDVYYDLAKLMHGLIVSHDSVAREKYSVNWNKNYINISINNKSIYKKFIKIYYSWLKKNNFDIKKIEIITGLIFLNIAALHHYPYSLFLYALGKKILVDKTVK